MLPTVKNNPLGPWLCLLLLALVSVPGVLYGQQDKGQKHPDKIADNHPDSLIYKLLENYSPWLKGVLGNRDSFHLQVVYTQVDRDKKGRPHFTDHVLQPTAPIYFYPASTVKLPVAALALEKLNDMKIPGLDRNSIMITGTEGPGQTGVSNDPTAADGRPSIAHYIKKVLLVSDNDAFNRLYEFLGQEYINRRLQEMGYGQAQILHRLSLSLTEEQNRHTNPVSFYDTSGKLIYAQPARYSQLVYQPRNTRMGKGYMQGDKLVNEPFDFSKKNRLPLEDLHQVVRAILFPDAVTQQQRFRLGKDDLDFLRKYMSMMPGESDHPHYDSKDYWDTYVKFLFYGSEKNTALPGMRVFNKVGDAYGFLIDAAYFADFDNQVEFFLSAVIYCNSDGIFNDDKYDYDSLGFPFMKELGRAVYEYEKSRYRRYAPDLRPFRYFYGGE